MKAEAIEKNPELVEVRVGSLTVGDVVKNKQGILIYAGLDNQHRCMFIQISPVGDLKI